MRRQSAKAFGQAMNRGSDKASTGVPESVSADLQDIRTKLATVETKIVVVEEKVDKLETKEIPVDTKEPVVGG